MQNVKWIGFTEKWFYLCDISIIKNRIVKEIKIWDSYLTKDPKITLHIYVLSLTSLFIYPKYHFCFILVSIFKKNVYEGTIICRYIYNLYYF